MNTQHPLRRRIVLFLILLLQTVTSIQISSSPCPGIFSYEQSEPEDDRWYGDITLNITRTVEGSVFRITLNKTSHLLVSWAGPSSTIDNKVYILNNEEDVLDKGTYKIRIMTKFNKQKEAPLLETIHFNGRRICPPDGVALGNVVNDRDLVATESTDIVSDINRRSTTSTRRSTTNSNRQTTESNFSSNFDNANSGNNNQNSGSSNNQNSGSSNNQNSGSINNQNSGSSSNQNSGNTNSGNNNANPNSFNGNSANNQQNNFNSQTNSGSTGSSMKCGTVSEANPLITNGQKTSHGQWPWHVALYKTEEINLVYLCGGSLVSPTKVITAAHCLVSSPGNKVVNYKSLVVYLGKYSLRQYAGETGVQTKEFFINIKRSGPIRTHCCVFKGMYENETLMEVSRLNVHSGYNSTNFHNDIAIITLTTDADYTNYVRPICMWEKRSNISDIINKEGVVAGWGLTEYEQTSEELKIAVLPVVSTETCLLSYAKFYSEYLTENSFCAGFRNGTSPCNGDSGGGLVFKRNHNWYLRGLVSLSVAKEGLNFCDPNYYVIFTDIAKYTDFIQRNLQ